MQTLASASNQALKTIAMKKFDNVIDKTKNYYNVMVNKYGDSFNPHADHTILSAVNDFNSFLDVVEKNNVLPRVITTKLHEQFVNAYTKGV